MDTKDVTIISYVGTYLTRDMEGLKYALTKGYGTIREVIFIFDGRSVNGEIESLSEDLVQEIMDLRDSNRAKRELSDWIERGKDTWARVSRRNLIDAIVKLRDLINPKAMGIEVKARGCNPRDTKEAIKCFGPPIFSATMEGRKVIYVEASMTRVGSPVIRWLVGITGNVTLYVPPREWADPDETFILNPRLSQRERKDVMRRFQELQSELEEEMGKRPFLPRVEYNYFMEAREPEEVPILGMGCGPLLRREELDPTNELIVLAAILWSKRKGARLTMKGLVRAVGDFFKEVVGEKVEELSYQKLHPRIRALEESGFVERRREGRNVSLSLTPGGEAFAEAFLEALRMRKLAKN